jgi:hypothetical protein
MATPTDRVEPGWRQADQRRGACQFSIVVESLPLPWLHESESALQGALYSRIGSIERTSDNGSLRSGARLRSGS